MSELIYSKQFTGDDKPDIQPDRLSNIFNYISQKVYKELVFVPIPGRGEIEKIFFFNAVELANKYKYDIRVSTTKGATQVSLSFDSLYSYTDLPHLIGMADSISLHSGIYKRDHTICLTFYTHEIYYNGRRILPDPEPRTKKPKL